MHYTWNDNDFIDAYNIAIQLGSRTSTGSAGSLNPNASQIETPARLDQLHELEEIGREDYHDEIRIEESEEANHSGIDHQPVSSSWETKPSRKKKKVRFPAQSAPAGTRKDRLPEHYDSSERGDHFSSVTFEQEEGDEMPHYSGLNDTNSQASKWTSAFPNLTAPPMPESFPGNLMFKKGDMSSLLMAWYMCGYHSGYYDASQDLKKGGK